MTFERHGAVKTKTRRRDIKPNTLSLDTSVSLIHFGEKKNINNKTSPQSLFVSNLMVYTRVYHQKPYKFKTYPYRSNKMYKTLCMCVLVFVLGARFE